MMTSIKEREPVSVGAWNARRSGRSIKIRRQSSKLRCTRFATAASHIWALGGTVLRAGLEKGDAFLQAVRKITRAAVMRCCWAGERYCCPRLKFRSFVEKEQVCGRHYGLGGEGGRCRKHDARTIGSEGSQVTFAL